MPTHNDMLAEAEGRLETALAERRNLTKKVESEGRKHFTDTEEADFIDMSTDIKALRERTEELREQIKRRNDLHNTAERLIQGRRRRGAIDRRGLWTPLGARRGHQNPAPAPS